MCRIRKGRRRGGGKEGNGFGKGGRGVVGTEFRMEKGIGKQGIGSVVRVAEREGWMGE